VRKLIRVLASLGFAAGIAVTTTTAADASTRQGDFEGCNVGYVCVYPSGSWSGGPELRYYKYGVYRFYDHYGTHRWFNNQTGGATARLCKTATGTDCTSKLDPWAYSDTDLTPYNSIRLDAS
jgi:hypothetical protein